MMLKGRKLWLIPIIVALVAVAGVFAAPSPMPGADQGGVALAAESDQSAEHCIKANEEQLDKMKEFWGEDITLGGLLEQVFPEVLEDMHLDHTHMFECKMPWAHMCTKDEVANLEVCWDYRISEDAEQAWIWFGSAGKPILSIAEGYIHNPEPDKYTMESSFSFDEQGKPIFGPVVKRPVEEITDEGAPLGIYQFWFGTFAYVYAPSGAQTETILQQCCTYDDYLRKIIARLSHPYMTTFVQYPPWVCVGHDHYYTNDDPPQDTSECQGWANFRQNDGSYWHQMLLWNTAHGYGGVSGNAIIIAPNGLPPNHEFRWYLFKSEDFWP